MALLGIYTEKTVIDTDHIYTMLIDIGFNNH